jgi:NTE family protein
MHLTKTETRTYSMTKFYTTLFVILFSLILVRTTVAQEHNVRPKIGLTLSGGGAKGLAHIGILEAIDSAGLKIDAITGTSMGSIVGALYAVGYSGNSIEQIARNLDWELMLSAKPQLNAISIEEKDEFNKYALEVPFEKGRFSLGKGIIEGQELWLKFAELFEPVYNISDFSKFSIPYKCIATDLETGNAVVLDHGDITTCVRASMAIPSVFTPVEYEGKTLVDGGLVNNFPVLDAKQMGAKIVIGVNLNKGLEKAEDLNSPVDILLQICFYKDAEHFQKHRDACDIYILPELHDFSAGSFNASDSIIDIGKETAKFYYPIFKRLADSLNAIYPEKSFVKDRLPKKKTITIADYTVDGLEHTKEKFFFGLMGLHNNLDYSSTQINEAVRRVYGTRYYNKINFDFIRTDSLAMRMHFKVQENPLTTVKFALNYNTFTSLGLIFNVTSRDLVFKESRALGTINISENPRIYLEYYKYIGKTRLYGITLSYYNEHVDFPLYQDFRLTETFRSYYSDFDLRLQYNLSRKMYIGIGQQYTNSRITSPESPNLTYNGTNTYWNTYLSFVLNSCDKKYFTANGWLVRAEAGYVYNQSPDFEYTYNNESVSSDSLGLNYENYARLFITADHYLSLSPKFVFSQQATLAYIIADNPYIANNFLVGGISRVIRNQVPFAGLNESEVKTGSIISAQLGLQYQLAKKMFLTGRFNMALYDFQKPESGKITAANNLLTGYGLTFGYDSAIGPIEMTAMYCDQDAKVRYNLNLGYRF